MGKLLLSLFSSSSIVECLIQSKNPRWFYGTRLVLWGTKSFFNQKFEIKCNFCVWFLNFPEFSLKPWFFKFTLSVEIF